MIQSALQGFRMSGELVAQFNELARRGRVREGTKFWKAFLAHPLGMLGFVAYGLARGVDKKFSKTRHCLYLIWMPPYFILTLLCDFVVYLSYLLRLTRPKVEGAIQEGFIRRFLTLYGPAWVVFAAMFVAWLWQRRGWWLRIFVAAVFIFELWFSWRINFAQAWDYGVTKLDNFFAEEFKGKESGVIPQSDNQNLNAVIAEFASRKQALPRHLSMIIYNENVDQGALDWIFYRYFFYHSLPTLYVENFQAVLASQGPDYFKDFQLYFVNTTSNSLLNSFKRNKKAGDEFEAGLQSRGLEPIKIIYGQNNQEMFRVYKFR